MWIKARPHSHDAEPPVPEPQELWDIHCVFVTVRHSVGRSFVEDVHPCLRSFGNWLLLALGFSVGKSSAKTLRFGVRVLEPVGPRPLSGMVLRGSDWGLRVG